MIEGAGDYVLQQEGMGGAFRGRVKDIHIDLINETSASISAYHV